MVPSSAVANGADRPLNLCLKHGSTTSDVGQKSEAPVEVVRKIALLCAQRFVQQSLMAEGTLQVVVRPPDRSEHLGMDFGQQANSGQIVEVAVLGGSVSDELGTGAAITSLIHRTLRSTWAIRSVRVTFI